VSITRDDIRAWLAWAIEKNATHMFVVCDMFDWEDYPVFVSSPEECLLKFEELNGPNMQKIMEVYDLSLDLEAQLSERRALHLPADGVADVPS